MVPCIYVIDGNADIANEYMISLYKKKNPLLINLHDKKLPDILEYITNCLLEKKEAYRTLILHELDYLLSDITENIAIDLNNFLESISDPNIIIVLLIADKSKYLEQWNIIKRILDPPQHPRWLTGQE